MKIIVTIVLFSLACLPAVAQLDTLSPLTVGVEAGYSSDIYCGFCPQNSRQSGAVPFALSAEYRIFRWLGAHLHLGHLRLQSAGVMTLGIGGGVESSSPFSLSYNLAQWALSIGPRLTLRVGQGDLGLEYRYGFARRGLSQEAQGINGRDYTLRYNRNSANVQLWRLGYTYWPTPRLALSFSGELASTRNTREFVPDGRSLLALAGEPKFVASRLLVDTDDFFNDSVGPDILNFIIGIHYRL